MIYTVIINDRSYDLPKKTMAVTEKLDEVRKVDEVKGLTLREKFKKLFDCVADLIGRENAIEALGSDNLNDVDLSEVTLAFRKIVDAYNKPVQDYNMARGLGELSNLPIKELSALANAASQISALAAEIEAGK